MTVVTQIGDARAFLLAEFVNAAGALVIAIERDAAAAIPMHIYHFEAFSVPNVCFHPAMPSLSYFV